MGYPNITSDSTHLLTGVSTNNAVVTGAGMLSAFLASCSNVGTITIHDSLNIGTDPRPLLILDLAQNTPIEVHRPYEQGFYFAIGISVQLASASGTPSIHFTTHLEFTP